MIYLYALVISGLIITARFLHGSNWATKWLLFAPCLLAAAGLGYVEAGWLGLLGVVPVLGSILLFFSGANADNTLSYMYRVEGSSRWNIVMGYSWRVILCCALLIAGCFLTSWWYALLMAPMIGLMWLVTWIAGENRHIAGEGDRDRNHRENVEWSEGALGAVNGVALWLVLIEIAKAMRYGA